MPIELKSHSPKTLEEAVTILYNSLDDEEKSIILNSNSCNFHHTIGRAIRNEWGLWEDSELNKHFKDVYGVGHADDMSGLILTSLKSLVMDEPFDKNIESRISVYKNHWDSMNVDMLTQEDKGENL